MDNIHTTCIVGFALFTTAFLLLLAAYIYYGVTGRALAREQSGAERDIKWAKPKWVYLTLLFAQFMYAVMYMMQYLDQGFTVKPSLLTVIWVRWIIVGLVGMAVWGVMCFAMSHKARDAQALYATVSYGGALFFLLAGSLSVSQGQRIFWLVMSILAFVAAWACLLFPDNRVWDGEYYRVRDLAFSERCAAPQSDLTVRAWAFGYRTMLLALLSLSYVAYALIWLLNDANELTSAISLDNAMVAYLVFDLLALVPVSLFFSVLTFRRLTAKLVLQEGSGKKLVLSSHAMLG